MQGSQIAIANQPSVELERKVQAMQEMLQRIDANVTQNAMDLQKTNEQLKEDNSRLHSQLSLAQNHLSDMKKNADVLKTNMTDLQNRLSQTQKQLSATEDQFSNVQAVNSTLQNRLVQTASKLSLVQNQLSLTHQQLLGVQSMVTCSRLWVISHDQFTIGKEIGRGAWASVHETTFRGATVAAKCLHKLITAPRTRQLFQREMEVALDCQHQNIVTFLGTTFEGPPVILMELMDTSLRSAYEQERVKDHQIHGILHDVAKALHFLHTRPDPVIHRDVSSANVLLKILYNGEWLAKLGDLGTAKIQQLTATTNPGAIVYGAPEANDFSKHSPKMDVYSFGVLIIEILTKTLQFDMVDTLKAQAIKRYPQYDQLVTSCTKQHSSDRPTMYDVLAKLVYINTD